jgi:hypothetical protein
LNGGRPGRKGVILGNSDGEWIGGLKSGRRSSRTIQTTLWGLDYGLHSFWMALDDAAMHLRYRTCPPLIGSPQTPLRSTDTELLLLVPTLLIVMSEGIRCYSVSPPPLQYCGSMDAEDLEFITHGRVALVGRICQVPWAHSWSGRRRRNDRGRALGLKRSTEYGCKCNHFKVTLWRDTVLVHFVLLIN